jgi:hypothetical membrane protein
MTSARSAARGRARRPSTRSLAWAAVGGVLVYVAVDVLLKFLRPGYSLLYNAESDYGRGPWFWVMDVNFLLRCALTLAVVLALGRAARPEPRLRGGLALLTIWAVCSGLLAFFADDIEGQRVHGSGVVHLVLAFIAFYAVAAGTILVSVALQSDRGWGRTGSVLLAISIAGATAFLLLASAAGHKHAPGGLYERIFLGLQLLWLVAAAAHLTTAGPAPAVRRVREARPAAAA